MSAKNLDAPLVAYGVPYSLFATLDEANKRAAQTSLTRYAAIWVQAKEGAAGWVNLYTCGTHALDRDETDGVLFREVRRIRA